MLVVSAAMMLAVVAPLHAKNSAPVTNTDNIGEFIDGPAIWVMSDEDTTIYFLGTIHILPEKVQWQTEDLKMVIGLADGLIMEVSDADSKASEQEMDALMARSRQGKNPVPIVQLITPENRPYFRKWARTYNFTMRELNEMQPWMLSFLYEYGEAYQNGADDDLGVENILVAYFEKDGRPIYSIETAMNGLLGLSQLSDKEQIWPFDQQLTYDRYQDIYKWSAETADEPFSSEIAWAKGDINADFYTGIDEAMGEGYYKALILDRNVQWTGWLKNKLDDPGTFLVAVGSAHLVGKDSVLSLLSKDGLSIKRLTKPMLAEAVTEDSKLNSTASAQTNADKENGNIGLPASN